jgi:hypothetical protein
MGMTMTVFDAAAIALVIWAPALLLAAYLVWGPRRTVD